MSPKLKLLLFHEQPFVEAWSRSTGTATATSCCCSSRSSPSLRHGTPPHDAIDLYAALLLFQEHPFVEANEPASTSPTTTRPSCCSSRSSPSLRRRHLRRRLRRP